MLQWRIWEILSDVRAGCLAVDIAMTLCKDFRLKRCFEFVARAGLKTKSGLLRRVVQIRRIECGMVNI